MSALSPKEFVNFVEIKIFPEKNMLPKTTKNK